MTERTVSIDGKSVKLRASALVPRLYRFKFGRDMMADMRLLQKNAKKYVDAVKAGEAAELTLDDLTVVENSAYIMARHADPAVPDSIDEWLEQFDGAMDIYTIMPEIMELWGLNNLSTSVPAKK